MYNTIRQRNLFDKIMTQNFQKFVQFDIHLILFLKSHNNTSQWHNWSIRYLKNVSNSSFIIQLTVAWHELEEKWQWPVSVTAFFLLLFITTN